MTMDSGDSVDSTLEQILAEVTACVRQVSSARLVRAGEMIESSSRLSVAGAGRSGLCMRALAVRLVHLGKTVHVVGESTTPGITGTDLLVIGSGSGRTAVLLVLADQARRQGAKILLFTTDAASPLAERADLCIVVPAPSLNSGADLPDRPSVQPMGTLFEQSLLILCDRLILALMQRTGVSPAQMVQRHANLE